MTTLSPSPTEFVRNLSAEDRGAMLVALLKDAIHAHGTDCVLPINDDDGARLGQYIPAPQANPERLREIRAGVSPDDEAAMTHALATPGDSVMLDQFLAEMRDEVEPPISL